MKDCVERNSYQKSTLKLSASGKSFDMTCDFNERMIYLIHATKKSPFNSEQVCLPGLWERVYVILNYSFCEVHRVRKTKSNYMGSSLFENRQLFIQFRSSPDLNTVSHLMKAVTVYL